MTMAVSPPARFSGEITVPGDKSISHRSALLGALARGTTVVNNYLCAGDTISTLHCLRALGIKYSLKGSCLTIRGEGLKIQPPPSFHSLDAGNSGTTARLLLGALAGQDFSCEITGDASLQKRPMLRVVEPLRRMGAAIEGPGNGDRLPLRIDGRELQPVTYKIPVASAQVKSAVLLAGLFAPGKTSVQEPYPTRDHTERILDFFGARAGSGDDCVKTVEGPAALSARVLTVPGDISSAAFFMAVATMFDGSRVIIRDVGVNPTRTGIIDVLREMGADISLFNHRLFGNEPVADMAIKGKGELKAVTLDGALIPRLIDEIPVITVVALKARGTTLIKGAGELRVKESDRISALTRELSRLGARITGMPDGMVIEGGVPLKGTSCSSHGDHRIAMALAVAGMVSSGETIVGDSHSIDISFPGFLELMSKLTK